MAFIALASAAIFTSAGRSIQRNRPEQRTAGIGRQLIHMPLRTMGCPECTELSTERDIRQLTYTTTALRLKAAEIGEDAANCAELRTKVEEAKRELKLVNAEIAQHLESHAVPNSGSTSAIAHSSSQSAVDTQATQPADTRSDVITDRSAKTGIGIFVAAYAALLVWFVRMINGL